MIDLIPIQERSLPYMAGFGVGARRSPLGNRMVHWELVKKIIESKVYTTIEVGLAEDWEMTNATVFKNGNTVFEENESGCGFFGCSKWATPSIKLDGVMFECWISGNEPMQPLDWGK